MKFWDSSALVPLIMEQPLSARAIELLEHDSEVIVWWGTLVECSSAINRVVRSGVLPAADTESAAQRLRTLSRAWYEVSPSEEVRLQAMRLLRIHSLRAADALQLAAALTWSGLSEGQQFVSFDDRLSAAARLEGLEA